MPHRILSLTGPLAVTALGTTAALVVTAAAPVPAAEPASAPALHRTADARTTTTVRYGPFTLPAASGDDHGETGNRLAFNIEKPCENCFITGFKPNLVYADGSNANVNTGPMLHHAVLGTHAKSDVVCGGPQRKFASGNERVESVLPSGYGIKVRRGERWNMLYDLMNHAPERKSVYITFTFTHEPAPGSRLKPVTPIWMDAGGCLGSAYDAPDGVSEKVRRWRSTISGRLVHMRGHVHHAGRSVRTENITTGKLLCNIMAEEGGSPEFIDLHGHTEISDMRPCSGDPLGTIERGDVLQITSRYESAHSHGGVMGIMAGWVAED
ncbi:hypothetical protein GR925_14360 [Streptomyces sp. HUCO-GS316]|uniref:hypothetical protein n=1 Tax=Streptomyces sp. HUCO-GS316 TaxID=2692198 RepID=UPI00136FC51A|nr:hypothetical protein [Streptomyces sp. HUCO-GS316]MXM64595.1 hypothetical protein [Streptomyces sp. HUCO-GS316]